MVQSISEKWVQETQTFFQKDYSNVATQWITRFSRFIETETDALITGMSSKVIKE